MKNKDYVAVLKVRSAINANNKTKSVLDRLRLRRKLTLVVFKNSPELVGQLKLVKDYVTYGEISEEFLGRIIEKRGKEYKGSSAEPRGAIKYKGRLYKSHFHLQPPKAGFERKGIKYGFAQGGVLGYRAEKIQGLLERML